MPGVEEYVALDRDGKCIAAMEKLAERWKAFQVVLLRQWDFKTGWSSVPEVAGVPEVGVTDPTFDLALMLKVVPVVARQELELLEVLASVPARRVIVSGARESMTKRRSIAKRERGVIERFLEESGFSISEEVEFESEVALLGEKSVQS